MESNQDTAALAQQIQALVATSAWTCYAKAAESWLDSIEVC